jgi:hypothetical protein
MNSDKGGDIQEIRNNNQKIPKDQGKITKKRRERTIRTPFFNGVDI